ncbi:MAG: galactose oxidase-like domain-containing protein [Gemmatimonadales bacterium]
MKHSPIVVLLLAAATITCGESLEAPPALPAAVTVLGGNNQVGVVGQALADPFVVQVLDAESRAVAGVNVQFGAPPDAASATVTPTLVASDAEGRAAARGTLGTTPGEWSFPVQVTDRLGRTITADLLASALAGPPSSVVAVRGDEQQGGVGLPLADSLVVEARDEFGNPVADVEVDWAAVGGGSVSATISRTGPDGLAAVQRTLGPASGSQGATAVIPGLDAPVAFHLTAVVGDASTMVALAGSGQSGPVGEPLPAQSKVRIIDPYGNPVPKQTVAWSAGQGGSADPASAVTGGDGVAATVWTLGGALGNQTLTATATGLPRVTLTATATPGPPALVAIITQPPISAVNGAPFQRQPQVELRDSYGNRSPADGVPIAVEVASGAGAKLEGTLSVKTANGVSTFADLRLRGPSGNYTLKFTSSGLSSDPSAPLSLVAGTPASIALKTQPSATATAGEPFDRQPALEVRDEAGNLLSGVPVTASIQSGGGTLSGATIVSTVQGVATYQALAIGGNSGPRTLRFAAGAAGVTSDQILVTAPPEARVGKWSSVVASPLVAIHMHLLPDGLVLMFGNKGLPRLWDAATGQFTSLPSPANLFCSGHAFLPDGRLLVTGGHITDNHGLPAATLFDYRTKAWTNGPPMARGRWYPTATTLANGEVLTVSGTDEDANFVTMPEVWTASNTWRQLGTASRTQPFYPRMFVAPNGRVYDVGPSQTLRSLNPAGTGSWSTTAASSRIYRDYGSAVMYQPGKVLIVGGGGLDSNSAPTATAEVIDLGQASPSWRTVPSMQYRRRHLNATLLPTGEVLVTGGTSAPGFNNPAGSVHAAELWNPETEQWTTLASNQIDRVYHSTTLLLPDGRVLHSGSGKSQAPDQLNYEIFSPPYLFKGARPTISSAPTTAGYGQTFKVGTPEGAAITKVSLIRLGSVTHAFDQNQRFNPLAFSRTSDGLLVTAPGGGNLAPPGHYMLFIVDGSGVPSVARIIRIQ